MLSYGILFCKPFIVGWSQVCHFKERPLRFPSAVCFISTIRNLSGAEHCCKLTSLISPTKLSGQFFTFLLRKPKISARRSLQVELRQLESFGRETWRATRTYEESNKFSPLRATSSGGTRRRQWTGFLSLESFVGPFLSYVEDAVRARQDLS